MPRLPGCLFKLIQKQPPEKFYCEIPHKIHMKNTYVRVSFLKFTKKETSAQLFSLEFCEISMNIFFTEHLFQSWRLLLLFIDLSSPFFHLFVASYRYLILSVSVLQLSYFL